ncbi:MAG: hypothetical protein ACRCYU_18685 [Nocardioides sp.]
MRTPNSSRPTIAAIALGVLALTLAACGGDDEPTSTPTSASTPATSPTQTKDPAEAWKAKFTPKKLKAYDAALQRWESYESRSEPIYAKGQATPAAQSLFKEFFPSPLWQNKFGQLKTYEQAKVKMIGTPSVYWSRAKSISDQGTSVEIEQCIDYTLVERTQNGQPIKRPSPTPQLRTLQLSKPKGFNWLIYGVVELVDGKAKPCKPE